MLGVIGTGETPSAEDSADALTALNAMLSSLSLQGLTAFRNALETFTLVVGQASYTVGPSGAALTTVRPTRIIDGFVRLNGNDYPVMLVDQATYDGYVRKGITTNLPDKVFYDPTLTNGTFYFYPTPSQANAFYFRSLKPLESFTTLAETVDLPGGYGRMLAFMLARELSGEYGRSVTPDIERMANEALMNLKRINHKAVTGSTYEVSNPAGRYNIYSDTWR